MNTTVDTAVLTTRQAAVVLGLSLSSVQKMVTNGELEGWETPGGHRRIHRTSVDRLLNARTAVRAPGSTSDAMRILLVEDEPIQVRFFESIVQRCNFPIELTVAKDASQALILLERIRPDLVVTDLLMRPFDGFHLIAAMEREAAYYPMDTIVLSSLTKEQALEHGPIPQWVTYYQKPADPQRVLGYLDSMQIRVVKRQQQPKAA